MKKIGVFSYRVKLILIWCVVILLATGMVSLGLTYNATRQMLEDQKAHLELLTEQVLINFINQTEAVARQTEQSGQFHWPERPSCTPCGI